MPLGRGYGLSRAPRLKADVMALSDEAKRKRRKKRKIDQAKKLETNVARNMKRIKLGKTPQSIREAGGDSTTLKDQKRVARTRLKAREIEEFGIGSPKSAVLLRRSADALERQFFKSKRRK